eukprot:755536-Hanusia_phi.AAC.3
MFNVEQINCRKGKESGGGMRRNQERRRGDDYERNNLIEQEVRAHQRDMAERVCSWSVCMLGCGDHGGMERTRRCLWVVGP